MSLKIKRIYEEAKKSDGYRILVDRLWPRGIAKEEAQLNEWTKDLAPSTALRKWFNHQPERFEEFTNRYKTELASQKDEIKRLKDLAKKQTITLVYSTKATKHNHAIVLLDILQSK